MRNYVSAERGKQWGIDVEKDQHLCESASAKIDHLTKGAIYSTDDDGYPTGELRDVFDAAACAQAAWMRDLPSTGGEALSGGTSFMSLTLPGSGSRSVAEVMETRVAPDAFEILSVHNLLFGAPTAGGWYRW